MKTLSPLIHFSILLLFVSNAYGDPQGKGHGQGKGHQGGMPQELRGTIHQLFGAHEGIERSVKLTETGYTAKTSSADAEIAKALQTHVAQMEQRFEDGFGVRNWDPAYVEFREHYDDLKIKIEDTSDGVSVEVIGTTELAIKVAQNHAQIISEFVKHGSEKMHATHAKVGETGDADSKQKPSGEKSGCRGGGECGKCGKCDKTSETKGPADVSAENADSSSSP